ncbi:hypothetical protein PQI08_12795, partial [Psychrobacter pacificensis]
MNFAQPPIVRSKKFEADYNNYHRLSGEGKRDTDTFRNEMKNFITIVNTPFLTQHHRRIVKPPACTQQVSY